MPKILEHIKDDIIKRKADNIMMGATHLSYKNTTAPSRYSLFGSYQGNFSFFREQNRWYLRYKLNMRKLFVETGLLSLAFGVVATIGANAWWVGFVAFTWLCGRNWVINTTRHGLFVSELAEEIDVTMGWKQPQPEEKEKDESLKSWF